MAEAPRAGSVDGAQPHPERDQRLQERTGESLLCQWVSGLFLDAAAGRNKLIKSQEWTEWEKAYWGDYWPQALPSYKSPININEIKRLLLTELSDLTDNAPIMYISKSGSSQRAKDVEKAVQAYWQRAFLDLTVLEACLDASVWPCGFFEIVWDPLKDQGQGDVVVRARPPQTVYPDPYATDDEDWRYVVTADVMDLNEVKQKWPDQGWRVKPDAARPDTSTAFLSLPDMPAGAGMMSPLYPVTTPVPTNGMDTRVTVYTCHVKDATLEVKPTLVKDPEGVDHLRRSVRYKYPQGRMIQCTSNVTLYDDRIPYGDGFPLLRCLLQPALHKFWPERSLVGELLELQRASDKLDSLAVENALRLQKGLIIADANSGIDPRTFADIPGQVVLKRPGSQVEINRPPPMPPDLIQHGARLRSIMREILGHQPARSGQPGRGNVSAELTETEISQAMGLTRLRARFLYVSMHKLVSKVLARMGQFYTHPRLLPFMEGEQWAPVMWEPLHDWQAYSAFVDPASFSIASKTLVKRLAFGLAKIGRLASDADLYRILEFPGGEEIAKRNQEQLKLAAQARANQPTKRRKAA